MSREIDKCEKENRDVLVDQWEVGFDKYDQIIEERTYEEFVLKCWRNKDEK